MPKRPVLNERLTNDFTNESTRLAGERQVQEIKNALAKGRETKKSIEENKKRIEELKKKKGIKESKEPESSSESESDYEVSPAVKKRQDLLKSLMKRKDKYTKPEYQEIYKAILGDKIDSKKDFKKVISNIKQIIEIKETMKTNKENNPKTKIKANVAELEQRAIKEVDDFLVTELDKIQKIDSGKKQLTEAEIKKIIGEYKKIKTKIDKVVKKIFKNDMKGKGIPKEVGDLIHIDIGSHNTKGEGISDGQKSKALDMALYFGSKPGFQNAFMSAVTPSEQNKEFLTNYAINKLSGGKIKGKGSVLGNIGMAYGNAWNQKAVKGSPEDKVLNFFHNEFVPKALKPIDVLAPPVGEVAHEGLNALKQHQGYGIKKGRGRPKKDSGLGYKP